VNTVSQDTPNVTATCFQLLRFAHRCLRSLTQHPLAHHRVTTDVALRAQLLEDALGGDVRVSVQELGDRAGVPVVPPRSATAAFLSVQSGRGAGGSTQVPALANSARLCQVALSP
jgi:hypothetical protein